MMDADYRAADRDRILQGLRRWRRKEERDDGPLWHGIGMIRQLAGGQRPADKDATRGQLIKLVAAGEVEVALCTNGVFYRSARPLYLEGLR